MVLRPGPTRLAVLAAGLATALATGAAGSPPVPGSGATVVASRTERGPPGPEPRGDDPFAAAQEGMDWLIAGVCDWMEVNQTPECTEGVTTSCFGCHVQAEAVLGLARSAERCYDLRDTPCRQAGDESALDFAARFVTRTQRKPCILGPFSEPCSAWGIMPTDPTTRDGHPPDLGSIGVYPDCGSNALVTGAAPVMQSAHGGLCLAGHARHVGPTFSEALLALADWLVSAQAAEGRWEPDHVEPPVDQGASFATGAAVTTLRAARPFASAAQAAAYDDAVLRAVAWTRDAPLTTNQDKAFGLVTLLEAGTDVGDPTLRRLRDDLLDDQLADGGWAERPGLLSNPYATGQALTALIDAGVGTDDPRACEGIQWLLETRQADGSWSIGTTGVSTDSTRNSDFTATIWPVLALGSLRRFGVEITPATVASATCAATMTWEIVLTNTADTVCGRHPQTDTYELSVTSDRGDDVRVEPEVVDLEAGSSAVVRVLWSSRTGPLPLGLTSTTSLTAVSAGGRDAACPVTAVGTLAVTGAEDAVPGAVAPTMLVTRDGVDLRFTWDGVAEAVAAYDLVSHACSWRGGCTEDPARALLDSRLPEASVAAPETSLAVANAGAAGGPGLVFYKVRATSPCAFRPGPTCNFPCPDSRRCMPPCP